MHLLVQNMFSGDRRALARLMTYVDNRHPDLISLMADVYPQVGRAKRMGITGPPGAGKSTLVDKLISYYRQKGEKVGVVAIDPSSPFTGGAVLGDRIRMMDHAADEGVFIRSLGTRGSHGGLSRATRDIVNLMDAFGFETILIETVGVGQTELDIMSVAQATAVVLVPESGDTIQTMKAGLMEIADLFVVNKADREGADRIFTELKTLSEIHSHQKEVPVYKTQAIKNIGVDEVAKNLDLLAAAALVKRQNSEDLAGILREECLDILLGEIKNSLEKLLSEKAWDQYQDLIHGHQNPYKTASLLLQKLHF